MTEASYRRKFFSLKFLRVKSLSRWGREAEGEGHGTGAGCCELTPFTTAREGKLSRPGWKFSKPPPPPPSVRRPPAKPHLLDLSKQDHHLLGPSVQRPKTMGDISYLNYYSVTSRAQLCSFCLRRLWLGLEYSSVDECLHRALGFTPSNTSKPGMVAHTWQEELKAKVTFTRIISFEPALAT